MSERGSQVLAPAPVPLAQEEEVEGLGREARAWAGEGGEKEG